MNNKLDNINPDVLDCFFSYIKAVEEAGGDCTQLCSLKAISEMTVLEMIETLGPNGVRFLCQGE